MMVGWNKLPEEVVVVASVRKIEGRLSSAKLTAFGGDSA